MIDMQPSVTMAAAAAAAADTALRAIFARYQAVDLFTHAVAAYGTLGQRQLVLEVDELPDGRDVFDLASLTKALVTTPLVFQEVVAAGLPLETDLVGWLGAAQVADLDPRLQALRLCDLLRHETGLPAWRNFWVNHLGVADAASLADPVASARRLVEGLNRAAAALPAPSARRPPAPQVYSDVGFLLLGLALQRRHGLNLAQQFAQFGSSQLGLDMAALPLQYAAARDFRARAVPTAFCPLRGGWLCAEVHDENCASLGGITGHAGLFGSAAALAVYLSALAVAPVGRVLWAANAAARQLPVGTPPNEPLMGWRQGADRSAYSFREGRGMGHLGFTGVAFWVCPEQGDYAMLLTNRVCSGRIRLEIAGMRRDVFAELSSLRI